MARQWSPGVRRGSLTDGLDVTNLPWMKQHASFDVEIHGQTEGAMSRDGGDNPGDMAKVYISGCIDQVDQRETQREDRDQAR